MNEVNWMQKGWECPKCGAVMSPSTSVCVNCNGHSDVYIDAGTMNAVRDTQRLQDDFMKKIIAHNKIDTYVI